MAGLKLRVRSENGQKCPLALRRRIRKAARAVLEEEGIQGRCELSVLLTDDEGIHALNREFRNVDRPTDVLSFPMGEEDPATGRLLLGDMVLNVDRAKAQGEEFGHGAGHELSYLTVHSVLHLLGYDHMEPQEASIMEQKQEAVLQSLGITRE